ncbi:histidine utilization repressor [Azospirillum halopraeferens]|uniref:histidine utilization repressor n=1 Tax=Azospirillum halopraeferens TaxID=34010 RepID=UPI0003F6FC2B|nr:histidine utilization repressor [Azospirillum halopraeferens]
MTLDTDAPAPLYRKIKRLIARRVLGGDWPREKRIPSENELVRELGVSRMTVHRALRELTDEGILVRLQGVGTFVAPAKPQSALLELRNIADEIRGRGHGHRCDVHRLGAEPADVRTAAVFGLDPGDPVYRSLCVHREDGTPVQVEDRWVNPLAAPAYPEQDFTRVTPNEYLSVVVPATEVEHVIEAVVPDAQAQRLLGIGADEPCLRLIRTTWSGTLPVTRAHLLHPGTRYRLAGRFSTARRGAERV